MILGEGIKIKTPPTIKEGQYLVIHDQGRNSLIKGDQGAEENPRLEDQHLYL